MGAAVSAGAARDGDLVETLRCYGCQCTWRQLPEQQEDAEAVASYSCPQCGGDFVERMSIGIAATRPRVPINEEVFRQVMEAQAAAGEEGAGMTIQAAAGEEGAGMTIQDLLANVAAFGLDGSPNGSNAQAGNYEEDPELREALERSMADQSTQPRAAPAASVKAQRLLK
ncbi:hypothetical protein T484DRAFT_1910623, partial [Baffinella frigidus]